MSVPRSTSVFSQDIMPNNNEREKTYCVQYQHSSIFLTYYSTMLSFQSSATMNTNYQNLNY